MKHSTLLTKLALGLLLGTCGLAGAAEITPINAHFDCTYRAKNESMSFELTAKTDGSLVGTSVITVAGKPSKKPFVGKYTFAGRTITAYVEQIVTRVRPGYTLPSQSPERQPKFEVSWVKDKDWVLALGPAVINRKILLKCTETPLD